jgi:hypothetical protein
MMAAALLLAGAACYFGIGLVVALLFVTFGIARVDGGATGAPIGFRLIIIPAVAILWPLVLRRWRNACATG